MNQLADGIILYHGSYTEVCAPDLTKCARYKDFGKGFYLTTSQQQAENFVKLSVKKAITRGQIDSDQTLGYVSTFCYHTCQGLAIKSYPNADADWLHCIAGHRERNLFSSLIKELDVYDVIIGKIANDNTNATIAAYMAQAYGEVGSPEADQICIRLLLPERLQDQYCFRTEKALKNLTFIGSNAYGWNNNKRTN